MQKRHVTLTGTVKSYADKELAVCRIERFAGVRALVDEINVELPEQHERADQDIAEAALRGLQWHVQVPDTQLRVKVEKGIVTLEGEVEHKYEETAAKNAVRDLMGVQGVVSLIRVKEAVSSLQIKKNIQAHCDGQNWMRGESKLLYVVTTGHGDMHDLTDQVDAVVASFQIRTGIAHVFNVGSTAAIGTREY